MSNQFSEALEKRRSRYAINKEVTVTDEKIQALLEHAIKQAPTAFNSQSSRVVLLIGEHHDKLWEITKDSLRKVVPAESFGSTKEKLDAFKAGYGTVLFFEDEAVVKYLQDNFSLYKDNFPVWSQQASGMLQYIVWTGFSVEGLGASLQHYNPLIDEDVKKAWNIPENWKLIAQLPFGNPTEPAGEKEIKPVSERLKVFK